MTQTIKQATLKVLVGSGFLILGIALYFTFNHVRHGIAADIQKGDPAKPVVVELFTSQSCYSCPPAEKFLGEMAGREDIIALEYHVDYWNDLNYMWKGTWKDPHSNPAWSERQTNYNEAIRGKLSNYTPQMIIQGQREVIGSRRGEVSDLIRKYQKLATKRAEIAIKTIESGIYPELIGEIPDKTEIYHVVFRENVITEVKSGENKGKKLNSHHIVAEFNQIGHINKGKVHLTQKSMPPPPAGYGCAFLAQLPGNGPVVAATYC